MESKIALLVFLISISSVIGLPLASTLLDNQFGNTQVINGEIFYYNMANQDNTTLCIPFTAGKSGTIKQWGFQHNSTAGARASYCVDTSMKIPQESNNCLYQEKNISAFLSIPFAVDWDVVVGTQYYFCYQMLTDEGGQISVKLVNTQNETNSNGDVNSYFGAIIKNSDANARPFYQYQQYKISEAYFINGTFVDFFQQDYLPTDVQYCMDTNTQCYSVYAHPFNNSNYDCTDTNRAIGQEFTYNYSNNTLKKIYLLLGKEAVSAGTFNIVLRRGSTTIYTSSALSYTGVCLLDNYLPNYGACLYTHNLESNIELTAVPAHYYLWIDSNSGTDLCTPVQQYLNTAWYDNGFPNKFGRESIASSYTFGQTGIDPSDMFFILEMEDDIYNPTSYQCNDGLDNDNDGFTDYPSDPACDDWNDNNEYPVNNYQCNDNIDNDGDGFTDYGSDPSCSSVIDDTEAPFDVSYECNDGLDNDGDGYTDHPTDPSCSDPTDDTEAPKDGTIYGEDLCLVEEGCLMKDTFIYSDELSFHGWSGDEGSLSIVNLYGNNKVYFDTDSGTASFNISKSLTNPNIYYSINSDLDIYTDIGGVGILFNDDIYRFYWNHYDSSDRLAISLRFDINRVSSVSKDYVKVKIYNKNGSNWDLITTQYPSHDEYSKLQMFLTIDQVEKKYDLDILEYNDPLFQFTELPFANIFASKVAYVNLVDESIDDSKVDVLVDNFRLYGDDVSYVTNCDTWSLPYYLKESFNGYPQVCDWSTNLNVFFSGQLSISQATPLYTQYKVLDRAIGDINNRYVTLLFTANVVNVTNGANSVIRLYDSDNYNFLTTYWNDGVDWWYDDNGEGVFIDSISGSHDYKFVIDMQEDVFDIYLDDMLKVDDAGFTDRFFNLQDILIIRLQIAYSQITLDNIQLYASTADGGLTIPDDEIPQIINTETMMCGIVYRDQPKCTSDSDCDSQKCLPHGRCARFSNEYCLDKGYTYGNKCFLAGMASCTLESSKDIIFDNFFLFAVFLIIIMIVVYLVIIFRR